MPFLLTILLLLTSLASLAQPPEQIKIELLSVAVNGRVNELFYRSHRKAASLQAFETGIGAPLEYLGPRRIAFYRTAADLEPRSAGEAPPKPVCAATLPAGCDRVLLLFSFPNRKSDLPDLRAFPVSTKSLKEGDYRLFNFSRQRVFANFAGTKCSVAPGKQGNLSAASWRREVLDLQVAFGTEIQGAVRPVYRSVWGHRPQRRMFLFLFDRPDPNRPLDIRKFYDVPSVKAPPAAAEPE